MQNTRISAFIFILNLAGGTFFFLPRRYSFEDSTEAFTPLHWPVMTVYAGLLIVTRQITGLRSIANFSFGNRFSMVGRPYMGHINSVLMALSKCLNPTIFQKTLSVNDFYLDSKEFKYPMGHISFFGNLDGETLKAGAPPFTPGWTLDMMARHSLDIWLTSEDLSDPDIRLTVDSEGEAVQLTRR